MNIEEIEDLISKHGSITAQPLRDLVVTVVLEAVEAERDACAKACEMQMNAVVARHPARIEFDPDNIMAQKCAAAIRARGQA